MKNSCDSDSEKANRQFKNKLKTEINIFARRTNT